MNLPRFFLTRLVTARPCAGWLALLITPLLAIGTMHGLKAASTDGPLRMEVITAYNFVVDSNIETPAGKSPSAAHLGVKIHNDGPTALTNVEVRIGQLLDPINGTGTPGEFESRTVTVTGAKGYSGTFALQMPGGPADAVRVIPRIEPGEDVAQYFFVTYPLKDPDGKSVAGAAPDPSDDLWLNYDLWAQADDGATLRRVDRRTKVTMRNEISAMANKIWPNTDSKVPNQYLDAIEVALGWRPQQETPRIPGAVVMEGIWYDLGNVGAGFDNNGDGIPDRNAWLQPVGNPALFSPLAARLVKCYGIVIVKLNDGTERLIPFEDQLYFENLPANNTGAVGLVYYEFLPLNAALPSQLTPYQEVASGFDNEKFNADYGAVVGSVATSSPQAQIVKTGPAMVESGQNTDYVITATNSGTVQFGWPDLALPLVIEDPVPAGLQYVAGSAAAGPNTTNPPGGAFSVFYSTDGGSTWSSTEPVPASDVKRLRWVLDRPLSPGESATVRFSANVPTGYSEFNVTNTAVLKTGTLSEVDQDSWTTVIAGPNRIGDFVWKDIDRDGVQDPGEPGIPEIGVSLYVDVNGDGLLDAGDLLYATTSTDSNGAYLFSSLPDARYIVVVDALDADLPYGYTLKAGVSDRFAVDLDSSGSNPSGVDFFAADWPFIEALEVTKTVSPDSYLEGQLVTYDILLDNHMQDLQVPQAPSAQTVYVTSSAFDKSNAAAKATEAQAAGAPDNIFTFIDWNANSDRLVTSGITPSFSQVGNITKVELVVRGYQSTPLSNDQLNVEIGHASRAINTLTTLTTAQINALVGVSQNLVVDITGASASWTWAQAQSLTAALTASKTGQGDTGDYNVDSIGFRVTTDYVPFTGLLGPNTITQWPLVDTYDPAKLQFVSASVTPDLTSPPGTLEWYNLGPVNAGARKTITVTFRALAPTDIDSDGRRDPTTATNTVSTQGSSRGFVPVFQSGLPAGHADSSVNVTINPAGRIGDFVYWDVNANSTFDAGDVPLSGVIVQLFQNPGSGFVYTGRSEITDSTGFYQFSGLADGTYQVRIITNTSSDLFSLPWTTFTSYQKGVSGTNQTGFVQGDTVVINNSNTNPADDFNLLQDFGFDSNAASVISGTLFRDWNGNGIQDPGDEPLAGYTVTLTGANSRTVTTDANGFYQFTNLTSAGNSTVTVTSPPANHLQTLDPDGTLNNATTINVALGNAYLDRDFAYQPSGTLTLGDTLYFDWNGNGTQDPGEGGIANISVRLYEDANGDGIVNVTDALIATTTTDVGGFYQFGSLPAGNYIVQVDVADPDFPASYVQTQDYDGLADNSARVSLSSSLDTVDFGYLPTGTASIGNQVWLDADNDGLKDAGEPGIDGVTVELYISGNTPGVDAPVASTSTSGGGFYSFSNLPSGGYYIYIPGSNFGAGQPLGNHPWSSTVTNPNDDGIDNDDNGIQTTAGSPVISPLITLGAGESDQTIDFGFTGTGSAGDFVFYDTNGNGFQDFSEPGIPNVTLRIYPDADGDGQADSPTPLATTVTSDGSDGNPVGYYQFTGLFPGIYFIQVDTTTLPAGLTYTSDPDRDGIPVGQEPLDPAGDDADSLVRVSIGSSYTGADFGYQPPGAIGDFVWLDLNQNGLADPGETGLANVEIEITDGATTFTVFTDFDGYWSAIVPDGDWTIAVVSSNFALNGPLANMLPTYDADGVVSPNVTVITVSGGVVTTPDSLPEGNLGIDFGYRLDGAFGIAGTVLTNDTRILGIADDIDDFYDDGTDMDAGPLDETELEGILVYLYTESGILLGTQFTDSQGGYAFTGLPAGTYRVIIGTTEAPLNSATLTTTVANNPATTSVDASSDTTVIQTVVVTDAFVYQVDFAFIQNGEFDYGDLPFSYAATTLTQDGARHRIPADGSTRWLGAIAPDAETNGIPHPQALGDDLGGTDDEDGVTPVDIGAWTNGSVADDNGGAIEVSVNGGGWLVAWIDWNNDGDFLDSGEFIISQAVSPGTLSVAFAIPAGTITGASQSWLSRFRLLAEQPPFPLFSYTGETVDGEVEDHLFEKTAGGSIGDIVWIDSNGNGLLDAQETGLGGVLIELRDDQGDLLASQTTGDGTQDVDGDGVVDPVGYYRFRDLGPGTYTVTIPSPPAGFTASYDEDGVTTPHVTTVVLAADVQHLTADFGYEPLRASISGQVRFDLDGDGDLEDPDDGAPFVRIQLWTDPNDDGDPSDGVQVAETFTDQNGDYIFTSVPTGNYVVVKINPSGAISTADVDGGNPDRIAVTIAGDDVTGRDFLITEPTLYTISGTAYEDNDASADLQLGSDDYPVEGVWIRIYLDRNGDGLANDGDPEIGAVLTDSQGAYAFTGLQPGYYVIIQSDPPGSTSLWDAQGAPDDNLIAVRIIDADVTERDFLDNNTLGGISGIVRADVDGDGNPDITLEGVLLTLLDASGQPVLDAQGASRTATTNSSGFYFFTDVPPGSYQMAQSQPAGYGSLSDKDGGNPDLIGDQQLIAVSNGSTNTGNDFLEFLQACPDQWSAWQDKWDELLGPQTGPMDNPDGDRYSNLLEYAFCMPPHSGIRKPFCLFSSETVDGGVDGVYSRTAGGAKDVIYQLELAQTLGQPTSWTPLVLDGSNTTVTNNGDGTETVRISDLEALFPLGTTRGFVRIRIILDDGTTQATDHTETLGWTKSLMDACCSTYNNPFLQCSLFTGTVDSVDGQDLVVATSTGPFSLATAITGAAGCYIEVTSGENTGRRYDVVSLGSDRITLADDSSLHDPSPPFNTHEGTLPADLAGDTIILRRHHTLDYLFAPDALGATGSQSTADQVQIFAGGAWTIYWLYDDAGGARWVTAANAGMDDMGGNVIPPGQGMFFNNRHDPVTLLAFGEVRENPFIRPMRAGNNLVGGGYPIDQSLNGPGGRAMNPSTGFFGSTDFKTADSAFIWQADADSAALGYHTYYLANGAPSFPALLRWVIVGDKNLVARDSETLLPGNRSAFIRTRDPIPESTCPTPWTP